MGVAVLSPTHLTRRRLAARQLHRIPYGRAAAITRSCTLKKSKSAPKSRSKTPPKKKSPAPKARPAPPAKRAVPRSGKPAAEPPKSPRGAKPSKEAGLEAAPNSAPPPPPPPQPAPRNLSEEEVDAATIPGEAIDGGRLSRAIRYAAKVTPKESDLVFTADPDGHPLVSGHDQRRCHTAFLPLGSAFLLRAAVPRGEAIKLADALDGLAAPMVRLGASGLVLIRHGVGQPAMQFRIGSRDITFAWEPPSQSGRPPAAGALRIQAAWQGAACRWSCAIVHTAQSADGIEWCTLTDEESGELLARAVLAEDGEDLFPEDDRQTELPGSRTAGGSRFDRAVGGMGATDSVADAVRDLKRTLRETGATMTVVTGEGRRTTIGAEPPDEVDEPVVRIDGQPVTEAPVEAVEPVAAPAVARQWIEATAWDALSAEARAAFETVEGEGPDGAAASAHITWERRGDFVTTEVSEDLAAILWDAAVDADLDLHEGAEPPTRVWVAEAAWNDLVEAATAALTEPVAGTRLTFKGRGEFFTALVPAAAFGALERRADEHDVTLHLGAEPPATNTARFG